MINGKLYWSRSQHKTPYHCRIDLRRLLARRRALLSLLSCLTDGNRQGSLRAFHEYRQLTDRTNLVEARQLNAVCAAATRLVERECNMGEVASIIAAELWIQAIRMYERVECTWPSGGRG
jgi:hypothetical protein